VPRTFSGHDLLQTVAFNEKLLVALLAPLVVFCNDINDSAVDRRDALAEQLQRAIRGLR
jgi:hypothetical protein